MNVIDFRAVVFATLRQIAPETDPGTLDPDEELRDQLDIDSMDFLNYVLGLNQATGIEITERDYPRLSTINRSVGYLSAHRQPAPAPG